MGERMRRLSDDEQARLYADYLEAEERIRELEKQIEENEDKIKRVDRLQEKVDRNRERSWDREMSRR